MLFRSLIHCERLKWTGYIDNVDFTFVRVVDPDCSVS